MVNITNVDPSVTVNDIKNAKDDDELKKQTNALFKQAHLHASNVPGTQLYWRATLFEFKADNSTIHTSIKEKCLYLTRVV